MHLRLIERAWSFYDVNNKVKMGNAVDDDIITRKKSLVTGVSRRKGIGATICEALADKDAGFLLANLPGSEDERFACRDGAQAHRSAGV
jgi:hypothetical protein